MASPTPLGIHQIAASEQYALVEDLNRVGITTDAAMTYVKDRAEYLTDKAVGEIPGRVAAEVDRVIGDTREDAAEALATANKAYEYNQALVAPVADVVDAVVTDPATESGALVASKLSVREAPLTPYQFGAVAPDSYTTDNTAALVATFNAARSSTAEVYLPPGQWTTQETLPLWRGMRLTGAGRHQTQLLHRGLAEGSLFEMDAVYHDVYMSDMTLGRDRGNGHLFNCTEPQNGLWSATFERMIWRNNYAAGGRIWNQTAGVCHRAAWSDIELVRNDTNPLAPFYLRSAANANGNRMQSILAHGRNNQLAPAIDIGSTRKDAYLTDWHFSSILGEQNAGGLIHCEAVTHLIIDTATDEDVPESIGYQADVFRIVGNPLGLQSSDVTMRHCTRYGAGVHKEGVSDIYAPDVARLRIESCNPLPTSLAPRIVAKTATIMSTRAADNSFQSQSWDLPPVVPALATGRHKPGRPGAMMYDMTLKKPIWADGTVWRDADGNEV